MDKTNFVLDKTSHVFVEKRQNHVRALKMNKTNQPKGKTNKTNLQSDKTNPRAQISDQPACPQRSHRATCAYCESCVYCCMCVRSEGKTMTNWQLPGWLCRLFRLFVRGGGWFCRFAGWFSL